jgi:hypothetical protein
LRLGLTAGAGPHMESCNQRKYKTECTAECQLLGHLQNIGQFGIECTRKLNTELSEADFYYMSYNLKGAVYETHNLRSTTELIARRPVGIRYRQIEVLRRSPAGLKLPQYTCILQQITW